MAVSTTSEETEWFQDCSVALHIVPMKNLLKATYTFILGYSYKGIQSTVAKKARQLGQQTCLSPAVKRQRENRKWEQPSKPQSLPLVTSTALGPHVQTRANGEHNTFKAWGWGCGYKCKRITSFHRASGDLARSFPEENTITTDFRRQQRCPRDCTVYIAQTGLLLSLLRL